MDPTQPFAAPAAPGVRLCCQEPAALRLESEQQDLQIYRCQVCGTRHFRQFAYDRGTGSPHASERPISG